MCIVLRVLSVRGAIPKRHILLDNVRRVYESLAIKIHFMKVFVRILHLIKNLTGSHVGNINIPDIPILFSFRKWELMYTFTADSF